MAQQHTDHRRWITAAASMLAAVALAALLWSITTPSSAAQAATSAEKPTGPCPGTLIDLVPLNANGKRVAELAVYYDRASGRNCARMNHTKATWGKRLYTAVLLSVCRETKPGKNCTPIQTKVDDDDYAYYAGPVMTTSVARGRCIWAKGGMQPPGDPLVREVTTSPMASHCGG